MKQSRGRSAGALAAIVIAALTMLSASHLVAVPLAARTPAIGPSGRTTVPPFGVGESLTFEIKYGFIGAGTAVIGIPDVVTVRGYPCYHIVSIAESNSFFSVFFRVRDVVESYMDMRELVPLRFEKRLLEGDFRDHDLVEFDHQRNVAVYPEQDGRVVPIAAGAQDILTSLYYVRMMDLEVGRSVYIENHADKKNYPLEIRVLRRERVRVDAGRFDCLVVEPVMRTSGLFRQKGRLTVWLTDDERKMPVLMKSKVIIGAITAELIDARETGSDRGNG
jgi:hypothetical protein